METPFSTRVAESLPSPRMKVLDNIKITDDPLMSGKVCPYCGSPTAYTDSDVVYPRSFGMIYFCEPCYAWVGVHKGTNIALGRLANAELRNWKKAAHAHFDPLWRKAVEKGTSKQKARQLAYTWLSSKLDISRDEAHIGMFDVELCQRTIEACENFREEDLKIEIKQRPIKPLQVTPPAKKSPIHGGKLPEYLKHEGVRINLQEWCATRGITALALQPTQLRFSKENKAIDIYPKSRKFHDLSSQKRGMYKELLGFLIAYFNGELRISQIV